jgi:hypothetical protein
MGSNIKHNMDARIINLDALYSMADATVNILATLIIDLKEGKRIGGFTKYFQHKAPHGAY